MTMTFDAVAGDFAASTSVKVWVVVAVVVAAAVVVSVAVEGLEAVVGGAPAYDACWLR